MNMLPLLRAPPAGESDDGVHGRIVQHHVDEMLQLPAHRLEGDA